MIKLPEKKYEPKHNNELKEYARGWNSTIELAKFLCNEYGDVYAIKKLLKISVAIEKMILPYFKGKYDCIVEIEKLNEEPEHRLDNFFQDSLEALDKLNIRGE